MHPNQNIRKAAEGSTPRRLLRHRRAFRERRGSALGQALKSWLIEMREKRNVIFTELT